MMFRALLCALLMVPTPGLADSVLAAVTIRSQTIIKPEHLLLSSMDLPGSVTNPQDIIGLETRVNLYANRPIRPEDVGPPTVIQRNDIVPLVFRSGGLAIKTEARALGAAGVGDSLRVMNLSSRTTVFGRVSHDGSVIVGPAQF